MDIAFVLGNGISRRDVSPDELNKHGHIYGCNALFRDFTPHVLVATDKPIAEHIESTGYPKNNKFYTRKPLPESGAIAIPKPYYGYSSGPVATALAALNGYPRIYMLGFDLGATEDKKFNNLYASTEFYKNTGSYPTYTGNWSRQIQHICKEFPNTKFIRVCGKTTARLPELDGIKNMQHLPMDQFIERINKQKDF